MKATVKTLELRAAIAKASLAIPKRATLPVLRGVLLKAQDSHLVITGNDLEKAVTVAVKAKVTHTGALIVSATYLRELLSKVKADTLTLETHKHTLKIEAGALSTSIEGQDPKEYPPIPREPKAIRPAPHLVEAMNTVLFAAAEEESRPVLTTVCVKSNGGTTDLVTADGFRLARLKIRGKYPDMLVPRDSVALMGKVFKGQRVSFAVIQPKVLKDPQGNIHESERGRLFLMSNGTTVITQLTTGMYPNYGKLIPQGGKPIAFSPTDLLEALDQVRPIAREGNGIVRLVARAEKMKVSARSEEKGESTVTIPCRGTGKIAFNITYLTETVRCLGKIGMMRLTTPAGPGVFRGENPGLIQVVMPMFVRWENGSKETAPPPAPAPGPAPSWKCSSCGMVVSASGAPAFCPGCSDYYHKGGKMERVANGVNPPAAPPASPQT